MIEDLAKLKEVGGKSIITIAAVNAFDESSIAKALQNKHTVERT